MRTYNFEKNYSQLLQPDINLLVSRMYEYKEEQTLFMDDKTATLVEIAKVQSVKASNKIEGIFTSDERLKKIVKGKIMPEIKNGL